MTDDPVCTDPDKYTVIFENDRMRVLEYRDLPGGRTHPHQHPDSVMYTLSGFRRLLEAARVNARWPWNPVTPPGCLNNYAGENIGSTPTHVLFVGRGVESNSDPRNLPSRGRQEPPAAATSPGEEVTRWVLGPGICP